MKFKKWLILILLIICTAALFCLFSITACNLSSDNTNDDNSGTQQGNNGNNSNNGESEDPIYAITYLRLAFRNNGTEYAVYGLTNKGFDLQDLTVPSSYDNIPITSITEKAFANANNLESIHLPSTIKSVESGIFTNCDALRIITVDENNARYKSVNNCLIDKSSDTLVAGCKNSIIPDDGSVTVIGMYSFIEQSSPFENAIIIPKAVKEIKRYAFADSGITSLTVLNPNIIIGDCSFSNCERLEYLYFEPDMSPDGLFNDGYSFYETNKYIQRAEMSTIMAKHIFGTTLVVDRALKEIKLSAGNTIYEDSFACCENLKTIIFPDNLTTIEEYAFSRCKGLQALTIPDSVTSIAENAFCNCKGLTKVTWSKNADIISDGVFYGCESLDEFTVPDNVTKIEDSAFEECNLSKITIGKNVKEIGFNSISGVRCKIYYQGSISDWCTIWDYSKYRDYYMPTDGSPLAERRELYIDGKLVAEDGTLTIPSGTEQVYAYAFYNISRIKKVYIDKSVTKVNSYAFEDCDNIEYANVPAEAVASIKKDNIKDVEIISGSTIEKVYSLSWRALERVFIAASITNIDDDVFGSCTNLSEVYYGGSEADWANVSKGSHFNSNFYKNCTIHYNCTGLSDISDKPEPDTPDPPSVQNYTLTYTAGTGGRIIGSLSQTVESGKDGSSVIAVANESYEFIGWSDGVQTAERQDMNVTENVTVTAQFEQKELMQLNGAGTVEDPYQISSAFLLKKVVNYPQAHFVLTQDIVFNSVEEGKSNFTPLFSDDDMFNGVFDGDGHKISNLTIYNNTTFYTGLFSCIGENGCVKNLTLENVNLSGTNYIGGIAGYSLGIIESCTVSGKINHLSENSYKVFVGGIVGRIENKLDKCTTDVKIRCSELNGAAYIGSVAGYFVVDKDLKKAIVSECYSAGDIICDGKDALCLGGMFGYVSGYIDFAQIVSDSDLMATGNSEINAGGLVGYCSSGCDIIIINSCTTSNVAVNSTSSSFGDCVCAGGFVGRGYFQINKCYAIGNVTVTSCCKSAHAGGFFGCVNAGSPMLISDCYTSGSIIATATYSSACAGGLIGHNVLSLTVNNSYTTGAITVTASGYDANAGGLVGKSGSSLNISSCYTVSKIIATSEGTVYSGALAGYTESFKISNAHWLYYTDSGVEYAIGYGESMGIPSSIGSTKHTDISDFYNLAEVLNEGLENPVWENIDKTSLPTLKYEDEEN